MTVEYAVTEKVLSVGTSYHLRVATGMSPRLLEGTRAGLSHSCCDVHILWQETPIAMGRIVGDGAINFDVIDITINPAHQGEGLGRLVMEKLITWPDVDAFDGACVTLVADVPELYMKFGFEGVRPESGRMAHVWHTRSR